MLGTITVNVCKILLVLALFYPIYKILIRKNGKIHLNPKALQNVFCISCILMVPRWHYIFESPRSLSFLMIFRDS
jgi:hypothetical protein